MLPLLLLAYRSFVLHLRHSLIPFQQNWRLTFTTSLAATGGSSVLFCTPTDTMECQSEGRTDSRLICVRWSGILAFRWVLLALSQGEMGSMCWVNVSSTALFCSSDVGEGGSSAFYMGPAKPGGGEDQNIDSFYVSLMLDEGRGCAQHWTLTTVWVGRISVYQFWLSLPP